jgi:mannitol/fructose-specific phosphotransferase system IIA component
MKDLIKEIAEDFEYHGVVQGEYESTMIKGEYNFSSTFMGSDIDILVIFEDEDTTDIIIDFSSDIRLIPEGTEKLLNIMLKMFVSEGFISWKEEYNNG